MYISVSLSIICDLSHSDEQTCSFQPLVRRGDQRNPVGDAKYVTEIIGKSKNKEGRGQNLFDADVKNVLKLTYKHI